MGFVNGRFFRVLCVLYRTTSCLNGYVLGEMALEIEGEGAGISCHENGSSVVIGLAYYRTLVEPSTGVCCYLRPLLQNSSAT